MTESFSSSTVGAKGRELLKKFLGFPFEPVEDFTPQDLAAFALLVLHQLMVYGIIDAICVHNAFTVVLSDQRGVADNPFPGLREKMLKERNAEALYNWYFGSFMGTVVPELLREPSFIRHQTMTYYEWHNQGPG